MQQQEKQFLSQFMYLVFLIVAFGCGGIAQWYYKVLPVVPEVIEVTHIVEVPKIIETTEIVKMACVPEPKDKKGWFK